MGGVWPVVLAERTDDGVAVWSSDVSAGVLRVAMAAHAYSLVWVEV